jgi:hypothetical protein
MSRIINPDNVGKERSRLSRAVVLAIRELARQTEYGPQARDLVAFIILALNNIASTIDVTVAPWEKRGYWVKADKFRMEWMWVTTLGEKLRAALLEEDLRTITLLISQISQKLAKVTVPRRNTLGEPWIGAWKLIQNTSSK